MRLLGRPDNRGWYSNIQLLIYSLKLKGVLQTMAEFVNPWNGCLYFAAAATDWRRTNSKSKTCVVAGKIKTNIRGLIFSLMRSIPTDLGRRRIQIQYLPKSINGTEGSS
jgi:hypothetical protein